MTGEQPTLGLVGCGCGGLESIRRELVEPLLTIGWRVAVTLTPTAGRWLDATGERARIEERTDYPVRVESRLPGEPSPHPKVDVFAVVPGSANTIAKLALGISDNHARTTLCEALGEGRTPVVIFPRINAAHARQPAWSAHLAALRRAGAKLIYGEDVWPLYEPRSAPDRHLPWATITERIRAAASADEDLRDR